jgi:hypothetical protein
MAHGYPARLSEDPSGHWHSANATFSTQRERIGSSSPGHIALLMEKTTGAPSCRFAKAANYSLMHLQFGLGAE